MHPFALVVELPDPVVSPRDVEPADEEEVVVPLDEIVERLRRLAEIDLWNSLVVKASVSQKSTAARRCRRGSPRTSTGFGRCA